MEFHDGSEIREDASDFFVGHDGQDLSLPPNPQGGTLWKDWKIGVKIIEYFQSVPPWGLGGRQYIYNKLF